MNAAHEGPAVVLLGHGSLWEAIAGALRLPGRWRFVDTGHAPAADWTTSLVISAHDTVAAHEEACSQAAGQRVPWLPVHAELDRVVIGPLSRPGRAGCPRCLERRRASSVPQRVGESRLLARHGAELSRRRSPLLGKPAAAVTAALVGDEAAAAVERRPGQADAAAVLLDMATLAVAVHRLLPDPLCPACGGLPEDSPEGARIALRSRVKVSAGSARTRELLALESELLASYVDDQTGVLSAPRPSGDLPLPMVSARLHPTDSSLTESGFGRTLDFRSSRLTAVAEALERLGGLRPGGKRTVVRGSYQELRGQALDPRTLGLYPDERHRAEGFPYERFHEQLPLNWVWAHSFRRQAPVLVPESYAYYGLAGSKVPAATPRDRPLVYEISNGCALGSCLEEAVLHGLLEVAERDAFLMTWYARMRVPRLDPATARDRRIGLLLERVEQRTGYQVSIFDITVEQRIPCIWVMSVDPREDPDRPRALCAAGSSLDPERAVVNALQELTTSMELNLRTYPRSRDRAAALVKDPVLVRRMEDHALLYSHPGAFDRLRFLLGPEPARSFADRADNWHWPIHADLRDDLNEILGRYLHAGLDVVVVDQTTAEHRVCGFACVKVIVPGALSMTFGHEARRVDGLPRLLEVPYRLGYRERVLTAADINPHPHPFP